LFCGTYGGRELREERFLFGGILKFTPLDFRFQQLKQLFGVLLFSQFVYLSNARAKQGHSGIPFLLFPNKFLIDESL
jgi:hypothetical protein